MGFALPEAGIIPATGSSTPVEPTMAGVLERFGTQYRQQYADRMPPVQLSAMDAIKACRTPELGGHVLYCPSCKSTEYQYHSCCHHACPKCNHKRSEQWLEARRKELLPIPYFHVVFTVPEELRPIIRTHQRKLYDVYFRSAVEALMELAADPKHIGGRIGILAVLHTWTRVLGYHPHIHCLVPAGSLDAEGNWHTIKRPWLVPHKALAELFRGKFIAKAREAVPGIRIPGSVFDTRWVIQIEPARHGTETVLRYLARYIHRVALSDNRICSVTNEKVVFRYRDRDRRKWRKMHLPGNEFIRRFLQHVLNKGFHKVRYYGLWSPTHRKTLLGIRKELTEQISLSYSEAGDEPSDPETYTTKWLQCPECGFGFRLQIAKLPPMRHPTTRGPPCTTQPK